MTQTQKHYINLETFNVTKQYNEQTIHFWSTTINAKLKAASQILRWYTYPSKSIYGTEKDQQ